MKRRRAKSSGPLKHVRLHRWLLESPAYRSLSLAARCLMVELYDRFNGENNGNVFLSVRDAAACLGIGKNRAGEAFGELEAKGFIRARQRGSFQWKTRQATTWVLTEYEFAGQPATKSFMRWRPAENQNSVPLAGTVGMPGRDHAKQQVG
jgi:hypothetical protein